MDTLNALAAGLFLLSAFGFVATRQVADCLRIYVLQSIFLVVAAVFQGSTHGSGHMMAVGGIILISRVFLIPWILNRIVAREVYARRELAQVVSIPTALLFGSVLVFFSFFGSTLISQAFGGASSRFDFPIGLAVLLLGAFVLMVRKEALAQVFGILEMENGAFFAGVAAAWALPIIPELAAAFDLLIIAVVSALLARAIYEHVGGSE